MISAAFSNDMYPAHCSAVQLDIDVKDFRSSHIIILTGRRAAQLVSTLKPGSYSWKNKLHDIRFVPIGKLHVAVLDQWLVRNFTLVNN